MTKKFIEIQVRHLPNDITPKKYKGKPYYNILYAEDEQLIIGFGTYKVEVLLGYLKDYFNIVPDGTSADLISRSALKETINSSIAEATEVGIVVNADYLWKLSDYAIDNAPPVDIKDELAGAYNEGYMCGNKEAGKERPQGDWIKITKNGTIPVEYICSVCGRKIFDNYGLSVPMSEFYPFCHCGADMRGGAE